MTKNSYRAPVAMVNYSAQLHDARQKAVSQDVLGHPLVPSIPVNTKPDRCGFWGSPLPAVTPGDSQGLARAELVLSPGHRLSPCTCHSCCVSHSLRWKKLLLLWFCKATYNQCHSKGVACLIVFPPVTLLERGASTRQALWSRTVSREGWAQHLPLPGACRGAGPSHSPGRC